ncbi:DEAD/DEAH box helicase [Horticoccus luteus]|uniref:DEAD/DEAH box helicase n=1 Tax=Horticoccus luteus TaxID=2862869 RepID=A0A8F9TVZ8_9BACT|nr:DEAD/DEAH box helicase [Horticoccus luteus]QYM80131.1 DEAD/DEAH box helicase [Horticoccus luteus]
MFSRVAAPALTEAQLFAALHPQLAAWFRRRFTHFSSAQRHAVPEILAGNSLLLTSPTGSGKTLAAFLSVFDHLARSHDAGQLPDGIVAVYVSPLRALAYDIQKNLRQPLDELGWPWLRVAARTGDTTPAQRAQQRRTPPHILVTTPESLTLLLSQPAWIPALRSARFLLVDELHALAENKRGSLLMVAAERLEEIVSAPPSATADRPSPISAPPAHLVRIGLSATVAPLDTVAEFLVGPHRPCGIAEITQSRPARIEVFSPLRAQAYPPAGYTATRVLKELGALLLKKETTLIFTNTRSGAETIGLRLKQLLPEFSDLIEVHHASLDRAVRLEVEDRLKRGELRAVVCSTSLEMGIDIGSIDLVVMVSAPKGVSRALQRIGRSGHSMGRTSHGILVASNINDLAECAVTARMMERHELEPVKIHDDPLDVLAQTLVGLAVFESVTPDEAFALVRRSYPFRALPRPEFDRVVRYLEGGGASLERNYRDVFGKIRVDASGVLAPAHRHTARDFYQNIGTIVSEQMVQVQLGRRTLGSVEESFMKGLRPGDVFVLNGRTIRLVEMRLLTAKVAAADSALPTVPRWYANKMPLASGLAAEVTRLRTEVARRLASPVPDAAAAWLQSEYHLSTANAAALLAHFSLQADISVIPTADLFLVEVYRDRGLLHYFFHSLIGRSANDALSRIVAQRVQETRGGNALVTIDDYGFLLSLQAFQRFADACELRQLFRRDGAEDALRSALGQANLVKWQFRGAAQTGLMVPRRVRGAERGRRALQWSSEIIFDVLRRHEPDHPLLREAYAEATLRFLDLPRALAFLDHLASLPWDLRELDRVSPFSFGIYVSKIKETMTLEDPETTIERLYHEMYGQPPGRPPVATAAEKNQPPPNFLRPPLPAV